MLPTFEAIIDTDGTVRLNEPVALSTSRRALVMILGPVEGVCETALLSEGALAEAWSGPIEDAAWAHLANLPEIGDAPLTDDAAR